MSLTEVVAECNNPAVAKRQKKRKEAQEETPHLGLGALFSPEPEVLGIDGQQQWKDLEVVVDAGVSESVAPERLAP